MIWEYNPEIVNPPQDSPAKRTQGRWSDWEESNRTPLGRPWDNFLSPVHKELAGPSRHNPFGLGTRKSYLPYLGTNIWESDEKEPFHAYTYRNPLDGKLLGYVRIPSYGPEEVDKSVQHFAALMNRFEQTTDGLVIDQINNPGGGVFYLYTLASMLTDQALSTPRHRIAITQNDVAEAGQLLERLRAVRNDEDARKVLGLTLNGYPVSYQLVQYLIENAHFIINEWKEGRALTNPTYLGGVDHINPSTVARYTRPILVLVNELDFSGGDFFPAILQDNKRAKIFGTRTSAAGGFVKQVEYPNLLGINAFSLTGSLAERADGNPIENLGVHPEIVYNPSEEDFQQQFKSYVEAVNRAISESIKNANAPAQ